MGGTDGATRGVAGGDGLSAVPGGFADGGGSELLGRCTVAAGQCASGGAVPGDGADVLEHGHPALGDVVDGVDSAHRVRGGYECHQLHGWHQRDYGRVCTGGSVAVVAAEWGNRFHRAVVSGGGYPGGAGVLCVQLPSEGEGEVLCRGCGKHRNSVHPAICHQSAGGDDGGCDVPDFPVGVRGGWLPDHLSSYLAA